MFTKANEQPQWLEKLIKAPEWRALVHPHDHPSLPPCALETCHHCERAPLQCMHRVPCERRINVCVNVRVCVCARLGTGAARHWRGTGPARLGLEWFVLAN